MDKKVKDLESSLEISKKEINDLEQYGRRTMVTVSGIPRAKDENTNNLILNLASKLDVELTEQDIDISHRTSNNANATIIVKFENRKKRNLFYFEGRKALKDKKTTSLDLGLSEDNDLYINESLTAINGELYSTARKKLLKEKRFKYIWTRNGKIFGKRDDLEKTKVVTIMNKEQINKLYYENPPQNV